MVKKKPISKQSELKRDGSALKRSRGPRKIYPSGQISEVRCAEIDAILANETRDDIRKRLITLRTIYAGGTDAAAVRDGNASLSSVRLWLQIVETKGVAALPSRAGKGRPMPRFSEREAAELREAVATALEHVRDPEARTRLLAVRAVLLGEGANAVAKTSRVTELTVGAWMAKLRRHGVDALLPAHREPTVHADAEMLRRLASTERDNRFALRLFAIALLAEGKSCQQAADSLGVWFVTIHTWRRRFLAGGVDGLRDRLSPKRTGRPGLSTRQRSELAALIRTDPRVTRHELSDFIRTRLGLKYDPAALTKLLQDEFGVVRRSGALVPWRHADASMSAVR